MFWPASEQQPVQRPGSLASPRNGRFPREGEIRTGATNRGVEVRENRTEFVITSESVVLFFSNLSPITVLMFSLQSVSMFSPYLYQTVRLICSLILLIIIPSKFVSPVGMSYGSGIFQSLLCSNLQKTNLHSATSTTRYTHRRTKTTQLFVFSKQLCNTETFCCLYFIL